MAKDLQRHAEALRAVRDTCEIVFCERNVSRLADGRDDSTHDAKAIKSAPVLQNDGDVREAHSGLRD